MRAAVRQISLSQAHFCLFLAFFRWAKNFKRLNQNSGHVTALPVKFRTFCTLTWPCPMSGGWEKVRTDSFFISYSSYTITYNLHIMYHFVENLILRKMVKTILKIVFSIKSYWQKNWILLWFFRIRVLTHMDITKTPIFLKIRLLDQWDLSRILAKIDTYKTGPINK